MNLVILALTVLLGVPFFLFGVWVERILQAAPSEEVSRTRCAKGEGSRP